jgi:hypothetical protein
MWREYDTNFRELYVGQTYRIVSDNELKVICKEMIVS